MAPRTDSAARGWPKVLDNPSYLSETDMRRNFAPLAESLKPSVRRYTSMC
jgi:hypothetical protein